MYKTLEIGANAVSSHLAHGDKEGKCSVVCNALCSQNNDECYQYRSISNSAEECWCNLNPKYVCGPNTECTEVDGINKCQCKQGYEGNATNTTIGCTDIDECANETLYDCNSNAQCVNIPGGYDCVCRAGYTGDGKDTTGTGCINVNECENVNSCDRNARCIDKPGFYLCECNEGYTGDGWTLTSGGTGCTRVCDILFTTETQSKNFDANNPTIEFVFGGLPDAEGTDGKNVKVITETTADINADGTDSNPEYFIIRQAENNQAQNVELGRLGENSTARICYQSSKCCTENKTFPITATNFNGYKSDGALTIQFDATNSVDNNGEGGACSNQPINDNTKVTLEYYPSCSSCRYIYIPALERQFNKDEPEINFVFNQLPKAQPNTTVTFTVMVHADINSDSEYFLVREAESDAFIVPNNEMASLVGKDPQDCDDSCCTEWKTFTMTAELFNSYASDGDVTIQLDATSNVGLDCANNMASVSIRYITCA